MAVIQLTCPGCQSKLNAKEELVGQTRNCPKCGAEVLIALPASDREPAQQEPQEPSVPADAPPEKPVAIAVDEPLPTVRRPERLVRMHQYAICDTGKLVAAWQNDGRGWMLRTSSGFVSAARNSDKIPTTGTFQLVELQIAMVGDLLRLEGLRVYRLANRWALMSLNKGDDAILATINAPGSLNRDQKAAVRQYLREHVMRAIWENADAVLEYLGNVDYHSPGVPVVEETGLPPSSDGGGPSG